jgi:OmpA-OmpF porin, OOP family
MKKQTLAFCMALGVTAVWAADDDADRGYSDHGSAYRADDRWYVTPFIGGISPDSKRGLVDHDWLYGAAVGHEFGPFLNLELSFDATHLYQNNNYRYFNQGYFPPGYYPPNQFYGPRSVWMYDISVDALGILNRDGVFAPYGKIGVGGLRSVYASPGPDYIHLAPEVGIGAFVNLWESGDRTSGFSLRPEITARFVNPGRDAHYIDYIARLGFQYSFGGTRIERHAAVYEEPAAPPVVYTPPPPPPPAPAADAGLQEGGVVTLTGVTFMHDSARLTGNSSTVLDDMAAGLKEHPHMRVEVQGHTDSTGTATYNEQLSQRRAESVRQYLIDKGVSPSQVVAHGYGESQPVDTNSTAAGRAHNRRVVAKVLSNPNNVAVEGAGETHLATPATPR